MDDLHALTKRRAVPLEIAHRNVVADGVGPDGAIIATLADDAPDGTPRSPSVLAWLAADGSVRELKTFKDRQVQSAFADSDGRYVVWVEESGSDETSTANWELWSFDLRGSSGPKLIAKHAEVAGDPVPGPFVIPRVDHGIVVWSATTAQAPPGQHVAAFVAPADGSAVPRRLIPDAASAVIAWPYVYAQVLTASSGTLVRHDLLTGKEERKPGPRYSYLAAGQFGVAGTSGTRDEVFMAIGLKVYTHAAAGGSLPTFPAAGDGFFVWEQRDYCWLMTPAHDLFRLGGSEDANYVAAHGTTLLWTDGTEADGTAKQWIGHLVA